MKIVALTTVAGPYILARWNAFIRQFPVSLYLIEFGKTSDIYEWEHQKTKTSYQRIILSEQSAQSQSPLNLSFRLFKELKRIAPDLIIINGYAQFGMLSANLWSRIHKKKSIVFSESKEDDAPRFWVFEIIKSWIINSFNAALVGGKSHKQYLSKLGMDCNAIFLGYDVVGNSNFHPDKIKYLPNPCQKPFFLAINRFISKKNLLFLINCYAKYLNKVGNKAWDLILCGDGELRPQIEAQITQLNLQNKVYLPGFLQQEELLPYFAHAGCFVHASTTEQWGLVVNEAMAAGLPVLVSHRCGCFEDLVIEGVNGFGFDPENSQQLTNLMLKISSENIDLQKMGQAALDRIQKYSPDYFARGLIQAIEYATTNC